ncbi:MAG: chemotaxis protein CheX [Candidatus Krumholzibacteria bacterium]|jgi:chemotaxis protein CheY-P-specific phosphatase CheC|nr:chemotaxis protein CheX [Candidatus Krumholzibacteria bacterium]MDY0110303.1 chemotaxis protein CheX [Candidatus Krumholzibacteria bacterium]
MSEDRQQALASTFLHIVEKLTFMFGEPVALDEIELSPEPWVEARMQFEGAVNGSLAVIVPESLQPEIAANILGLEAADLTTPDMLADALREMLNVVCGHVIMTLAGAEADFKLLAPQHQVVPRERLADLLEDADSMGFTLDDEPLLLHLELERG